MYTDYLLSTFGLATATGLPAMVNGEMSHDQITRFLSEREYTSKDLWLQVKLMVRQIERDDGVLIFDDTIQEKEWAVDRLNHWPRKILGFRTPHEVFFEVSVSCTKPSVKAALRT